MTRATCLTSDDALRSQLRERRLATLLATLVARQRESADLALADGDLGTAASLEESSAMATHRLGLFEDAMLAILRAHPQEVDPSAYVGLRHSPAW